MRISLSSSLFLSLLSHFYNLFSYVLIKTNYLENSVYIVFLQKSLDSLKRTASLRHHRDEASSGLNFPNLNPGQ